MKAASSKLTHPSLEVLALYSRRDLPLAERLRIRYHVAHCSQCEHQALLFESATSELRRESGAETLTAFEAVADWNRLEAEMLGNIAVGVDAARCIQKVRGRRTWIRTAGFATALSALFVAGWVTHIPENLNRELLNRLLHGRRPAMVGSVVQTTGSGIEVRSAGGTLTILHPRTALVSLSGSSSLEARYIDEDSGQVTITNVYGQ